MSPEDIMYASRGGDSSAEPLSELQRELIGIATGLARDRTEPLQHALLTAEAEALNTEHQGALFVQRELLQFFRTQRERMDASESSRTKADGWVVL